jgi:hypothetical protein
LFVVVISTFSCFHSITIGLSSTTQPASSSNFVSFTSAFSSVHETTFTVSVLDLRNHPNKLFNQLRDLEVELQLSSDFSCVSRIILSGLDTSLVYSTVTKISVSSFRLFSRYFPIIQTKSVFEYHTVSFETGLFAGC